MIIALLTIGLIFGTAFLVKNAKIKKSIESYVLVLLGGIITFLFEPTIIVFFTDGSVDGGAIQMASTIAGVYFIGWSIVRMAKYNKEKNTQPADLQGKKIIYFITRFVIILIILWLIILVGDIKILISETKVDIPYIYEIGQGNIGETTRLSLLCRYFNGRKIVHRTYMIEPNKEYCSFINID